MINFSKFSAWIIPCCDIIDYVLMEILELHNLLLRKNHGETNKYM